MLHIFLHILVPLSIALAFYAARWQWVFLLMMGGMVIDIDHLLADPVYDPLRCSIGFHPLHSEIAIGFYVLLIFLSQAASVGEKLFGRYREAVKFIAIGLAVHIVLDALDCRF